MTVLGPTRIYAGSAGRPYPPELVDELGSSCWADVDAGDAVATARARELAAMLGELGNGTLGAAPREDLLPPWHVREEIHGQQRYQFFAYERPDGARAVSALRFVEASTLGAPKAVSVDLVVGRPTSSQVQQCGTLLGQAYMALTGKRLTGAPPVPGTAPNYASAISLAYQAAQCASQLANKYPSLSAVKSRIAGDFTTAQRLAFQTLSARMSSSNLASLASQAYTAAYDAYQAIAPTSSSSTLGALAAADDTPTVVTPADPGSTNDANDPNQGNPDNSGGDTPGDSTTPGSTSPPASGGQTSSEPMPQDTATCHWVADSTNAQIVNVAESISFNNSPTPWTDQGTYDTTSSDGTKWKLVMWWENGLKMVAAWRCALPGGTTPPPAPQQASTTGGSIAVPALLLTVAVAGIAAAAKKRHHAPA